MLTGIVVNILFEGKEFIMQKKYGIINRATIFFGMTFLIVFLIAVTQSSILGSTTEESGNPKNRIVLHVILLGRR